MRRGFDPPMFPKMNFRKIAKTRIGKRGALYGVGIGLVLGILYWLIFAVFTKFGEVGNLPAVLAAWSANILFALAAGYMFLQVET